MDSSSLHIVPIPRLREHTNNDADNVFCEVYARVALFISDYITDTTEHTLLTAKPQAHRTNALLFFWRCRFHKSAIVIIICVGAGGEEVNEWRLRSSQHTSGLTCASFSRFSRSTSGRSLTPDLHHHRASRRT